MAAEIWEDEFYYEIEERRVPGAWTLYEDESLHMEEKGAKYTQRTFARFKCSGCTRWWNSAEVHVLFFMNLNRKLKQGTIKMKIFRQECKKCSFPKWEMPEISHENIVRITTNLVNRILQVFYGKKKAKQDLKPEVYSQSMEGPHDKEHCEACKLMICEWQTVATKKPPAVTNSFAVKKPARKRNTRKKSKQCADGRTSNSFTSTATYQDYETEFGSTFSYSDYGTDFQYDYPTYETERYTAYSPTRKTKGTSFPVVASLIAGIGALALWYFKR